SNSDPAVNRKNIPALISADMTKPAATVVAVGLFRAIVSEPTAGLFSIVVGRQPRLLGSRKAALECGSPVPQRQTEHSLQLCSCQHRMQRPSGRRRILRGGYRHDAGFLDRPDDCARELEPARAAARANVVEPRAFDESLQSLSYEGTRDFCQSAAPIGDTE